MLIFKARNTLRTEEHHLCTVHAAISSFFFFWGRVGVMFGQWPLSNKTCWSRQERLYRMTYEYNTNSQGWEKASPDNKNHHLIKKVLMKHLRDGSHRIQSRIIIWVPHKKVAQKHNTGPNVPQFSKEKKKIILLLKCLLISIICKYKYIDNLWILYLFVINYNVY